MITIVKKANPDSGWTRCSDAIPDHGAPFVFREHEGFSSGRVPIYIRVGNEFLRLGKAHFGCFFPIGNYTTNHWRYVDLEIAYSYR